MKISRREFLTRIGQAGGYSATFVMMQSLGLMPMQATAQEPIRATAGSGKGIKVVVLGGGIAGLVSAYELRKLGYEVTVLEARERPGGRVWTLRGGSKIVSTDGTTQMCSFDEGNYQNAGAARLPSVHRTILGYCKELGVPLEVEVNTTRSSYLQHDGVNGGAPIQQRRAINDTRGHVSELLGKCINAGALDAEMTKEDRDRTLTFLRSYGPLDDAGKYVGSNRAGYAVEPGAGDLAGTLNQPIDMHTLLDEQFWDAMLFEENFDMQATMFQPVGGMDRIPYAFAKVLGSVVEYNAPVTEIRKTAKGVRVGYMQNGSAKTIEADYCFCGMPLTMLRKTPNDFSAPYKKVIDECVYGDAYKIAWEARRFWEQDYNVYGGMEFVTKGCSPVWLPSAGMFSSRGVLVSGYSEERGTDFQKLTMAEKFAASRQSVEQLHPGHSHELEKPVYIGWGKIPYSEGSWIDSYLVGENRPRPQRNITGSATSPGYETLIQPDGPVFFVGCHVSHIVAWQEGAALSARRAVGMLADRVNAARLAGLGSGVVQG